nr:YfiR family protein [Methylomarinum sp. Ch1-1]MDP4519646.1 YfiR family protein [Methylomarinum sp. Ch1-1]
MKRLTLLPFLMWPLVAGGSLAVDTRELTIKAAYLFRLSLFVDWPADKLTPSGKDSVRFCIAGDRRIHEAIKNVLTDKSINRHQIRIDSVETQSDLTTCHLLFIAAKSTAESSMLKAVANYPVLTIGESAEFYRRGGMILLFNKDNRMRFAINQRAADRAGVKLGAQLLNLAEQYR